MPCMSTRALILCCRLQQLSFDSDLTRQENTWQVTTVQPASLSAVQEPSGDNWRPTMLIYSLVQVSLHLRQLTANNAHLLIGTGEFTSGDNWRPPVLIYSLVQVSLHLVTTGSQQCSSTHWYRWVYIWWQLIASSAHLLIGTCEFTSGDNWQPAVLIYSLVQVSLHIVTTDGHQCSSTHWYRWVYIWWQLTASSAHLLIGTGEFTSGDNWRPTVLIYSLVHVSLHPVTTDGQQCSSTHWYRWVYIWWQLTANSAHLLIGTCEFTSGDNWRPTMLIYSLVQLSLHMVTTDGQQCSSTHWYRWVYILWQLTANSAHLRISTGEFTSCDNGRPTMLIYALVQVSLHLVTTDCQQCSSTHWYRWVYIWWQLTANSAHLLIGTGEFTSGDNWQPTVLIYSLVQVSLHLVTTDSQQCSSTHWYRWVYIWWQLTANSAHLLIGTGEFTSGDNWQPTVLIYSLVQVSLHLVTTDSQQCSSTHWYRWVYIWWQLTANSAHLLIGTGEFTSGDNWQPTVLIYSLVQVSLHLVTTDCQQCSSTHWYRWVYIWWQLTANNAHLLIGTGEFTSGDNWRPTMLIYSLVQVSLHLVTTDGQQCSSTHWYRWVYIWWQLTANNAHLLIGTGEFTSGDNWQPTVLIYSLVQVSLHLVTTDCQQCSSTHWYRWVYIWWQLTANNAHLLIGTGEFTSGDNWRPTMLIYSLVQVSLHLVTTDGQQCSSTHWYRWVYIWWQLTANNAHLLIGTGEFTSGDNWRPTMLIYSLVQVSLHLVTTDGQQCSSTHWYRCVYIWWQLTANNAHLLIGTGEFTSGDNWRPTMLIYSLVQVSLHLVTTDGQQCSSTHWYRWVYIWWQLTANIGLLSIGTGEFTSGDNWRPTMLIYSLVQVRLHLVTTDGQQCSSTHWYRCVYIWWQLTANSAHLPIGTYRYIGGYTQENQTLLKAPHQFQFAKIGVLGRVRTFIQLCLLWNVGELFLYNCRNKPAYELCDVASNTRHVLSISCYAFPTHTCVWLILGATLRMLLPSVRNITCVGLTVQDGGTLDLRSRFGEPTDQWSIAVRLAFGSLLSLSLSC